MKAYRGNVIYAHSHANGTPTNVYVSADADLIKVRPMVVVSNDKGNESSSIVLAVPMTTKVKAMHLPTHCIVSYHNSMVMCEQIYTIAQDDIDTVAYHLTRIDMDKVDKCLLASLGMVL